MPEEALGIIVATTPPVSDIHKRAKKELEARKIFDIIKCARRLRKNRNLPVDAAIQQSCKEYNRPDLYSEVVVWYRKVTLRTRHLLIYQSSHEPKPPSIQEIQLLLFPF